MTTPNLTAILSLILEDLRQFATRPTFVSQMMVTFGRKPQPFTPSRFLAALSSLPPIEVGSLPQLGGELALFDPQANKIYLAQEALTFGDEYLVKKLLLEEIGHYLDEYWGGNDAEGDEGAIFASLVLGEWLDEGQLRQLKRLSDRGEETEGITVETNVILGTSGDDRLEGTPNNDLIIALEGNDIINGNDGDDIIQAGPGNDIANGGAGNDTFGDFFEPETIEIDHYDGGTGIDRLIFRSGEEGLTLTYTNINNGVFSTGGTLRNVEELDFRGGSGNDVINASAASLAWLNGGEGDDTLIGGAGNDILIAGSGTNRLVGNGGDDTFISSTGDDTIVGGPGRDIWYLIAPDSNIALNIDYSQYNGGKIQEIEAAEIYSGSGNDFINLSATGTPFVDNRGTYRGYALVRSGGGNDTITGGLGNDTLDGEGGDDVIVGVNANRANPGVGEIDILIGGSGRDRFILGNQQTAFYDDGNPSTSGMNDYADIQDFNPNEDTIELHGNSNLYRLVVSGSDTLLYIDKPGSEPDELISILRNVSGLSLNATYFNYITSNRPPTNLILSNNSIPENSPLRTVIGTFTTVDPDLNDTFTYRLVEGNTENDNRFFTLQNNQLQSNATFDFETKNRYVIRVRTTDRGALFFERDLVIAVTDVNEPPTDIELSNNSIVENAPIGTFIGNLISIDPDVNNTFTYSLVPGGGSTHNNLFTLENNQLRSNAVFDFESRNTYQIRVRSTDQGGLSFEKPLTITIIDVNEPPTDVNLSNNRIAENLPIGTVIGNLTSVDPDADNTFTYSLVGNGENNNNPFFSLQGNQLRSNIVFDFETQNNYTIQVRTTDQGGLFFEKPLTITILDANDPPTELNLSNNTIAEKSRFGTIVGVFSTVDPDVNDVAFTYSLVPGNGSTDNRAFFIENNQLKSQTILDFETKTTYNIRVRTTDRGGLFLERALTITVTNVNEVPQLITPIPDQTALINEPFSYTLSPNTFRDPDGDTLTYTATLIDGSPLPNGLTFDGFTFRGNLPQPTFLPILVTATDANNASIKDTFNLQFTSFDPAQYGASHPDLIAAFGNNLLALTQHYQTTGKNEGRAVDTFDEKGYLASNLDVLNFYGNDPIAATNHYLIQGFREGRVTNSFNASQYLASYPDLINFFGYHPTAARDHYLNSGYQEGRFPDVFPEDIYLASYPDLLQFFGYNLEAATQHYISQGMREGRTVNGFDPNAYLNKYGDLRAVFGDNLMLATRHYIEIGYYEGRTII